LRLSHRVALLLALPAGCGARGPEGTGGIVETTPTATQTAEEALPPGVQLAVGEHDFESGGAVKCWMFATNGLAAIGQTELVFLVRKQTNLTVQSAQLDVARFVAAVYQAAGQGLKLTAGGYMQMDVGVLGRDDFTGGLFIAPEGLDRDTPAWPYLFVVFVTGEELDVANCYGHNRITARLGFQVRYYPTPPWTDPARDPVVSEQDGETLLARTGRLNLPTVYVHLDQSVTPPLLVLDLAPSAHDTLARALGQLPADAPLALLGGATDTWDSMLVWRPGSTQLEAINPEGSPGVRMGGNHLLFVPGSEDVRLFPFEDGYWLALDAARWAKVRQAFLDRQDLTLDDPNLQVRWREETYVSPVDGERFQAEGGWETHEPTTRRVDDGPAVLQRIMLLTTEDDLAAAVTVEALSDYITGLRAAATSAATALGEGPGHDLVLRVVLQPDQPPNLVVSVTPDGPAARGTYLEAFTAVTPPAVQGQVVFELPWAVRGGAAASP
jgi:hypothetical protein